MKTRMPLVFLAGSSFLATLAAQIPPSTIQVRDGVNRLLLLYEVTESSFKQLHSIPFDPSVGRAPTVTIVDPSTGDLWGAYNGIGITPQVARFEFTGSYFQQVHSFPLYRGFDSGLPTSFAFDQNGRLYLVAGATFLIDLETGANEPIPRNAPGILDTVAPSRGGRPRIDDLFEIRILPPVMTSHWWRTIASVDEAGSIQRVFFSREITPWSELLWNLWTTSTGRTFFFSTLDGYLGDMVEIDWARGRLRAHDFGPNIDAGAFLPAEGLGKLLCNVAEYDSSGQIILRQGIATFDLESNTISTQWVLDTNGFYVWRAWQGWFPQNILTVFPHEVPPSTSFRIRASMGGEVGDLGAIVLESVTVGGQTIPFHIVLVLGPMNENGLVTFALHYDPSQLPFESGDALSFRGYRWDGQRLHVSDPQQILWN